MRKSFPHRHSRAFTLPEVLIASVVLATAVAAISQAISSGQVQSYEALRETRALALAEALMEEIVSRPYADPDQTSTPGPEAGETSRALYDNCDDYHDFKETAGNVADAPGVVYPPVFAEFSRQATVTNSNQNVAELGGVMSGVTVTVTVTDERGREWKIRRFVPELP